MKKFYLVIFLLFVLPLNAFANTGISFIYINGSNIKDEKIKKWYSKGVQKFHPNMKNAFEQNAFTQRCFLKNGNYFIEESPVFFSWGDKDHNNSTSTNKKSILSKGFVIWLACKIRTTAKNVLHDIIWIQDYSNMNSVLDKLHETVKAEIKKGNKIVLYGYSSGSFITYDYLLKRTPYINVAEFFNSVNVSKEERDFVSQHPMRNTCMSALEQELAVFSADGHIIIDNDFDSFKESYTNLNEETCMVCIPDNTVLGTVNIASPLVLFNSDISDPNYKWTYYNRLLYKYMIEDDMFWLTVNYREDPLSFPCGRNLTIEELENIANLDIEAHKGFIYDQSDTRGGISAITHLHYLSKTKALSKKVVKAYVDGYRHQYDKECKQNTANQCQKTFDFIP